MVRILRHNRHGEDLPHPTSVTQKELQAAHGNGTYLPASRAYLCALPPSLFDDVKQLSKAKDLPPIATNQPPVVAFIQWLRAATAITGLTAVWELVPQLDDDWVECLVTASIQTGSLTNPLLTVMPTIKQRLRSAALRAWTTEYKDCHNVLDSLVEAVDLCMKGWKTGFYIPAWTMVLQSSGWGKSRSILQLATKGFYVVYVSFMEDYTGIPERSPVADLLTGVDARDARCIAAWMMAIFSQIEQKTPEEWSSAQQLDPNFLERVTERYAPLKAGVLNSIPDCVDCSSRLRAWVEEEANKILPNLKTMEIIVCLDEVESLFTEVPGTMEAFKRFFSSIPRNMNLLGLGLAADDTSGNPPLDFIYVCDLWPMICMAGSPCWDVGKVKPLLELQLKSQLDPTIPSNELTRELFKLGRPLWGAILDHTACLDDVVTFAIGKLSNERTLISLESLDIYLSDALTVAVIGVAAGLEVAASSDLAQELVGHMRTVIDIRVAENRQRMRVFTADLVEPILGEAAARILDEDRLCEMLESAEAVFKESHIVEGRREGVVGRLVLVLAIHACCKEKQGISSNRFSHPVQLYDFLTKLCGKRVEATGLVCFNRFVFFNRQVITPDLLLFCFVSCVAIIPEENHLSFDALIPRLMPGLDGTYELRADRMRGVPVQFRGVSPTVAFSISWWTPVLDDANPSQAGATSSGKSVKRTVNRTSNVAASEEPSQAMLKAYENLTKHFPLNARDFCEPNQKKRPRLLRDGQQLRVDFGIHMHLGGGSMSNEVEITEDGQVMIMRSLRTSSFLKTKVADILERMCSASFKLDRRLYEMKEN